jgi:deoxyribose-phosphate aldolase
MNLSPAQLAAHLDSTNLRLDARAADITALCQEAALHRFACVMIYPTSVSHAAKAAEIEAAHEAGAHEVDIVMDHAALRDGELGVVDTELRALSQRAHNHGQLVKVIVETCYLDADQRITALRLCEDAGVEFIKTSTGFGAAGAKAEHIAAWAAARRGTIQLKASGGIKTLADARALIEAGATRLGTSSAAAILAEFTGAAPSAAPGSGY